MCLVAVGEGKAEILHRVRIHTHNLHRKPVIFFIRASRHCAAQWTFSCLPACSSSTPTSQSSPMHRLLLRFAADVRAVNWAYSTPQRDACYICESIHVPALSLFTLCVHRAHWLLRAMAPTENQWKSIFMTTLIDETKKINTESTRRDFVLHSWRLQWKITTLTGDCLNAPVLHAEGQGSVRQSQQS